mgnify:CR=1 FL=1
MSKRSHPVVMTDSGALRGKWSKNGTIAVFRGVPYAAPPSGPLRWRPPAPVEPWTGERPALKHGPRAFQRESDFETFIAALIAGQGWSRARAAAMRQVVLRAPRPGQAEDCLHLAVRSPQLDPAAKLPVMVWIHGGDHNDGSGGDVYYASNALASLGVVTVAINYRLGLMGYFAHPELAAESEHGVGGNYGTLDQIAALRWVRDNIAGFGGDPDNVTIFGESAGGESVLHMMTSPLADGLFHRAIVQSGANSSQMIHLRAPFLGYDSAEQTSAAFAAALGITGPRQLERLRERSPAELYALVRAAKRLGDHFPVIDGHVLPESPFAAFAGGREAAVPLMIGSTADEGTIISPVVGAPLPEYRYRFQPADTLPEEFADAFGERTSDVITRYPGLDRRESGAVEAFLGDHLFGAPAYWYATHHATRGAPTWLYLFARTPPSPTQTAGAYHAAELPFVHGRRVPIFPMTDDDLELGSTMRRYWTSFAGSGDPNAGTAPPAGVGWPSFDPADPRWLRLDHEIVAEPVDRTERYDILNAYRSRLVGQMAGMVPA